MYTITRTKKGLIPLALSLLLSFGAIAQNEPEVLTLDDCIRIALENNIGIKRAQNNAIAARANKVQALANYLPDLNAGAGYSFFFGNVFDLNAARQISETTKRSNPNLNSSVVLFNGFSNTHNYLRRANEEIAAGHAIDAAEMQVEANVLGAYLAVIIDRENIKISDQRIELLQNQLTREEKRVSVGVSNPETVYNFRSQLANERLNKVTLQNQYDRDKLALVQLLQLDPVKEYNVEDYPMPEEDILLEAVPYDETLAVALAYSPALKQANANHKASLHQFRQAKAGRYPTISAFGELGSNYSSNGARNPENGVLEEDASFFDQMAYNKYQFLAFNLSIPIFTRLATNARIQNAKIAMYNAGLDVDQAQITLTNTVQQVYADLKAAQSTYNAAQENMEALTQSFGFAETRYNAGSTDFYTYFESLNNKNRADIQLINSRYSIIFRQKILDIYRGMANQE